MTDDELIERLTRTLRDEASTVTSPEGAWERFASSGQPGGRGLDRRLWLGLPAAGLVAAAAIVAVVVLAGRPADHKAATSVAAGPRAAASPQAVPPQAAASAPAAGGIGSTTGGASSLGGVAGASSGAGAAGGSAAGPGGGAVPPTPAVGPPAGPVPAGFRASSVTFVSPAQGWVLGSAPCAQARCAAVLRTTDGGQSWGGIPAPAAAVTSLRFADPMDGWAWGAGLWATHDGGASWHRVTLMTTAGSAVTALEASDGSVQAAVFDGNGYIRLETSPVTGDAWRLAPIRILAGAGPVPHTQLVLQGPTGWVIQVDRTVVSGARLAAGQWQAWTPPCANVEGPATLAASSSTDVAAVCDVGEWSTPQGEHLYRSSDGGSTFAASSGVVPVSGVSAVASPSVSTIAVAGASGLKVSFDSGRSWASVAGGTTWADLGFTTSTQGVAISDGGLLLTRDGGHTWAPVSF